MSKFSIGDSVKLKGRENVQTVNKVTITEDGEFVKLCGCSVNFKAEDIEKVESKTDCKFEVGDKVIALTNIKDGDGECYFKKGDEAEIEFILRNGNLTFLNVNAWSFNPLYFEKVKVENDCEFKVGDIVKKKDENSNLLLKIDGVYTDDTISFEGYFRRVKSSDYEKVKSYEQFQLNYINLDDVTIAEQLDKLDEEVKEVKDAVVNRDIPNILEEGMDVIQVILGLIQELELQEEFIKYNNEGHYQKLLSKGHKLTEINKFK